MGKMKANRKFIKGEEAVSAVIGVILMVAITVAIAATVYVYVSGMIGTAPQTTPNVQFQKNDVDNTLLVSTADPSNLQWKNINITISPTNYDGIAAEWISISSSYHIYSYNPAYPTTYTGNCSSTWGIVTAGNRISFPSGASTITMRWIPTNTLMGTWTFS